MSGNISNLEWLSRNGNRSFPLQEDSARTAINTGLPLPNSVLVDAFILVPSESSVYVSALTFTPKTISIALGEVSSGRTLATAIAIKDETAAFSSIPVTAVVEGVSGSVSIGDFINQPDRMQQYLGTHFYSVTAVLEARCVLNAGPMPVQSIREASFTSGLSEFVELVPSSSMSISVSTSQDSFGDTVAFVQFDAVNPSDFVSPCETIVNPEGCPSRPIKTINGVEGDPINKNITIEIVGGSIRTADKVIKLSYLADSNALCQRTPVPDQYGRLPLDYEQDAKPTTPYNTTPPDVFPLEP